MREEEKIPQPLPMRGYRKRGEKRSAVPNDGQKVTLKKEAQSHHFTNNGTKKRAVVQQ